MIVYIGYGAMRRSRTVWLETGDPFVNRSFVAKVVRRGIGGLAIAWAIEVRSSVFKVYPLDTEGVADSQQLDARARVLYERVLTLRRDEADRLDEQVISGRATAGEIEIGLQEEAAPGTYVVMWRVLSVDTHVVSGYYVFTYAPAATE